MTLLVIALAAAAACRKTPPDQNVVLDINNASPNDIEALPPDESSATPSNELINGDDNPGVNDLGNTNSD
ncbi:MAG: hypothetical protein ACJ8EO_08170 [Sphingomicrobium sp.]